LRVVHHRDQGPLLGHVRQQAQGGQADEKTVRGVATAATERDGDRVALRFRQAVEAIHEWRAELMQPSERELHLRLDARRAGDSAARSATQDVSEQRALPDARLAAQHQRPARTRPHARDQFVERRALAAPPKERRHRHEPRLRMARDVGNQ
jgi:hypothetical protein